MSVLFTIVFACSLAHYLSYDTSTLVSPLPKLFIFYFILYILSLHCDQPTSDTHADFYLCRKRSLWMSMKESERYMDNTYGTFTTNHINIVGLFSFELNIYILMNVFVNCWKLQQTQAHRLHGGFLRRFAVFHRALGLNMFCMGCEPRIKIHWKQQKQQQKHTESHKNMLFLSDALLFQSSRCDVVASFSFI